MPGEFLDEYGALDGLWASGGVIGGRGDKIFFDLFELAGAALLGVDGFEMVAHYVGGDDFDVAGEGVGVLLLEGAEDAEVVGTELEVGFLEQVVYGLFGGVAESAGGAQDDGGDEAVEAADELLPGFGAARCGAAAYQFLNRYGGVESPLRSPVCRVHILQGFLVVGRLQAELPVWRFTGRHKG